tara:strand:- start:404 stop:643 length:240 start_codon:yes stop_codon:yes gene_type:complete
MQTGPCVVGLIDIVNEREEICENIISDNIGSQIDFNWKEQENEERRNRCNKQLLRKNDSTLLLHFIVSKKWNEDIIGVE